MPSFKKSNLSKLTNRELTNQLKNLAKYNNLAQGARDKIISHCLIVYGVEPGEVDNDVFIDLCDGGCGASSPMSAKQFDNSMKSALKKWSWPHGL